MPKIFSLKNIFWVRPYNLSYTHQDPHRNFEGSFDFHLYPAIKRYLVLLYSWVLCCLDLQGLWFRSGLGPKIFLNSIQVDWHLFVIALILSLRGAGGLILKTTISLNNICKIEAVNLHYLSKKIFQIRHRKDSKCSS